MRALPSIFKPVTMLLALMTALIVTSCQPDLAHAQDACMGPLAAVTASAPPGTKFAEMPAELRSTVETNYNAGEPKTDYRLSHVLLAQVPSGARFLIFVTGEDCVIDFFQATPGAMEKLLKPLSGA